MREVALQKSAEYDDRYILALPDIWGKEVSDIGAKPPFLYDPCDGESLELDAEKDGMRAEIEKMFDKRNSERS